MKTVVILDDYQNVALKMADWSKIAERAKVRVLDRHVADRDELIRELSDAHALVCNRERTAIDADLIAALPQLELIVTSGMRNASIDIAAAQARSIPVCGTATLGYPTAELTVAMILGFFRHLPQEVAGMTAGGWQTTVGRGLRGKTLGVVGYGRIGRDVGKVALALGMQVLGFSRSLTPERAAEDGVVCADLDRLLRESDVVSLHLAVNAGTRGIIGAAELAKMKPTALLVNTARSALVDQEAMVRALHDGSIGGAALDVYDIEPLPADHALRTAPNTLLSPHLGYVMEENYQLTFGQALENVEAWLDGAPKRIIPPAA